MARAAHVSMVTVLLLLLPTLVFPVAASAPVDMRAAGGAVIFTFDYGYATGTDAATILEAHGARGTFYVMSSALREGPYYTDFMSAQEVTGLAARGHQIGSQGVTGSDLTTLDAETLTSHLSGSKYALQALTGSPVAHLAYPFGATNDMVISAAQAYYFSGRTVTGSVNDFLLPLDGYQLPALIVDRATTLATATSYVDFARSNNVTVIFDFQRISDTPGPSDWSRTNLSALLDHVSARGVAVRTVSELFPTPAPIAPGAPTLAGSLIDTGARLTWTTPNDGGSPILGYNLYRGSISGATTLRANLSGNATGHTDTELAPGAVYFYQVSARTVAGEGPRSSEVRIQAPQPGYTPGAIVFTFDNGYATGIDAAAMLESRGMRGTFYVISQNLRQGPYFTAFMSAQDLANLSRRGHDIQSQTVTGADLTLLNATQLALELAGSKDKLQNIVGLPVTHLAYPFAATSPSVVAAMAGLYASGRTVTTDINMLLGPQDPHRFPAVQVTQATTLAQAKAYADFAIAYNITVVLDLQRITPSAGLQDWTTEDFGALLDHVKARNLTVKTFSELFPTAAPIRPIPPQMTVSVVNGAIHLNWTTPPSGGSPLTGYKISRGVYPLVASVNVSLPATATSWRDTNITLGTTYGYQIRAINTVGEGNRSPEARVTPRAPGVSKGAIVLTFDDSSADHFEVSKQLESYGWRGTFFVVTGDLSARRGKAIEDTLTKKNIQSMSKAGHDMQPHTLTHSRLTDLTPAQAEREMAVSQLEVQNMTGKPARHFAYPESAISPWVAALAAKYFSSARAMATNMDGPAFAINDRYAVPSLGVQRLDTDLTRAKSYVDMAIAEDRTIILTFHRIVVDNDPWDLDPATFEGLLDYMETKNITVMTYAQLMG